VFFVVEPSRDQLIELARPADGGAVQVLIDQTYPLSDAGKAFDHVMSRGGKGKVALTVTGAG